MYVYEITVHENGFVILGTLKGLINSAKCDNIEFVYAISPGIDIIFSSPADKQHLKDKLGQVSTHYVFS